MPGEETTVTTETPNAAQPAPAAPATETPVPAGRVSFAERMKSAGWDPKDDPSDDEDGDEESDETEAEEPSAPAAAAKDEKKPEAETARPKVVDVKPDAAKQEQFATLAKELGFEVDGKHVVAQERIRFREKKREELARIQQHQQQVQAELGQLVQSARAEIDFGKKARELIESGDFDGLAAHYGKKDWNDLNTMALTAASDPQWKANLDNRRKLEQMETERQQERQHLQRIQQQQQEAEAHRRWHSDLEGQMKGSGHKLLEAFADDSPMRDAIIGIQRHYYHQAGGREAPLSAAQALRVKVPGLNVTLEQQMNTLYERLGKALGRAPEPQTADPVAPAAAAPTATKPAEAPKKNGKRPAPKTGVIDPESKTLPSRRGKWTPEEWRAHTRKVMSEAEDAE